MIHLHTYLVKWATPTSYWRVRCIACTVTNEASHTRAGTVQRHAVGVRACVGDLFLHSWMKSSVSVTPWLGMPLRNESSLNNFFTYSQREPSLPRIGRSDAISRYERSEFIVDDLLHSRFKEKEPDCSTH